MQNAKVDQSEKSQRSVPVVIADIEKRCKRRSLTKKTNGTSVMNLKKELEDNIVSRDDDADLIFEKKSKGSKQKITNVSVSEDEVDKTIVHNKKSTLKKRDDSSKINLKRKMEKKTTRTDDADLIFEDKSKGKKQKTTNVPVAETELIPIPQLSIETAKSNRSKCQVCQEIILKDTAKIGAITFYKKFGAMYPGKRWFHISCGVSLQILDSEKIIDCKKCNETIQAAELIIKIDKKSYCAVCINNLFIERNQENCEVGLSVDLESIVGYQDLPINLQRQALAIFQED